jgi:hypothetical protein
MSPPGVAAAGNAGQALISKETMDGRWSAAAARAFSFPIMAGVVMAAGVYLCCYNRNILSDPDIWWHLRNAQYLLAHHSFLRTDLYSSTIYGKPWINPEWLSELPYYAAWKLFGFRGIYFVAVCMIELLALGVCALAWQRLRNIKAAVAASATFVVMASVSMSPRTQLLGWMCFVLELFLLENYRQGKDRLWALPVIFALWVNLHGSWPIGLLTLLISIACGWFELRRGSLETLRWTAAQRRRLLLILALSVAAAFLNPYGWRLVAYPFQIAFHHPLTLATVVEWQSLDFHSFRGKFVFALLASLLLLSAAARRMWSLTDLFLLLFATLAAFTYSRFLLFEAIVLPPLLARELTIFSAYRREIDKPWMNFAIITAMAVFLFTHFPAEDGLRGQAEADTPARAVLFLKSHPPKGRLLNDFNWGGYLIWKLPRVKVFIDTRADAFEAQGVFADYVDAMMMKRPLEVLDRYRIESVLLPKSEPLSYLLVRTPGWVKLYDDGAAVVLERSAFTQPAPVLDGPRTFADASRR